MQGNRGRIAVDAMGGDVGPTVVVAGAIEAARAFGVALTLVGQPGAIEAELRRAATDGLDIAVLPASDTIEMDEHPAQAVRRKPNSSLVVAVREVKGGRADGVVSAGNSGALMAAALLELGRVAGVDRPALGSLFPSARERTMVIDLGAVTDPKPHHLVQFAIMGHVYATRVLGVAEPVVGLLSNGEEPTKGSLFVQEVYPLLAATPGLTFRGNVEGKDIPLGTVDIVVTDGFTGNVALKVAEGAATMLANLFREEITKSVPRKLAAFVLRGALRTVKCKLDYSEVGGAPLLGVNGTVVIAHGRSDVKAIKNAIGVACSIADQHLAEAIRDALAAYEEAIGRRAVVADSRATPSTVLNP